MHECPNRRGVQRVVPLLLLVGCDYTFDDTGGGTRCTVSTNSLALKSDGNAFAYAAVAVGAGTNAVQFVAERSDEQGMTIDYLVDPHQNVVFTWEDWYASDESLTQAFYLTDTAAVLNWPVRAEDTPLTEGTWTAYIGTYDTSGAAQKRKDVEVRTMARDCGGSPGSLSVTVAYASGLYADGAVSAAVDTAIASWRDIYGSVGIGLEVQELDTTVDPRLPAPYDGSETYRTLYESAGGTGVLVVVGDTVDGMDGLFGMSGGIPGPDAPTSMSAVAISWLEHAGADGQLSADETAILGETIAHECGHYLGLFHPVETTYDLYDALDDTDRCTSQGRCESTLGNNLMFPYPLYDGASSVRQVELTSNQSGVLHNWVGVR